MKNLESTLTALESNTNFFDITVFEEEMMDIPYQISLIDENIKSLTKKQYEKFIGILAVILKKAEIAKYNTDMQKNILIDIRNSANGEYKKVA